jgi:hypothetical protein
MPYVLLADRKRPGRFWVQTESTGRLHSIQSLPKKRAQAQMRALYAIEHGYTLRNK